MTPVLRRFFYRKMKFHLFIWTLLLLGLSGGLLVHYASPGKLPEQDKMPPEPSHHAPSFGGTKYIV